jgi:HD-like signal output (HDOD) protein
MVSRAQPLPSPKPAAPAPALERAQLFWQSAPDQAYRHLCAEVGRAVAGGTYKTPVLPEAAIEALKLARNALASIERIERLIATDPPLAARLLSLANSPVYRGFEPFHSLRAALVRLGLDQTREVLAQAVLTSHVFDVPQFHGRMAAIAAESSGVALVCAALAVQSGSGEDYAFLAGLLHDLGKAILLQIAARVPEGLAAPADAIERLCEDEHGRIGREAAKRMRLAEPLIHAIARHHEWSADVPSDLPAVLVSLGRRAWNAAGADPAEPIDTWPELPVLDLVPVQLHGIITKLTAIKPRILALGALPDNLPPT